MSDSTPSVPHCIYELASKSVPVFPLQGKQPLEPGGFKTATTDLSKLELWAELYPGCNWGMPAGRASGYDVLDIDGEEGLASLRTYLAEHGPLPETPTQKTGSGGLHVLFRASGQVRNSAKGMAPGWDTRGDGGYIVISPSIHPQTGQPYEWLDGQGLLELEPAPWPEELLKLYQGMARTRSQQEPEARIPQGVQEHSLTSLAGTMRARGMSEGEMLAALRVVSQERCDPPVQERDLERIAGSVCKLYSPDDALIAEPTTDAGNARRFASLNRGRAFYIYTRRTWYVWDGRKWRADDLGQVMQKAKTTAHLTGIAAASLPLTVTNEQGEEVSNQRRTALIKWALASEDGRRLRAMLELAQDELAVTPDQLDRDPWLLNVENGTLDLRTGHLKPHSPADLLTKASPVAYEPTAQLELWDTFLDYCLAGDRQVRDFLQLLAGASLCGLEVDQLIALVHGPAASGKTTATEAIRAAMGDYAVTAAFSVFLKQRVSSGPAPEIVKLAKARLVTAVEVDEGQELASALLKQMTGGDQVTARGMYQREGEDFTPVFTLWMVCNDAPLISQEDDGLWRRVVRVPFERVVPVEDRDASLKLQLKDPEIGGPAVLAWMVQGCLKWQSLGMKLSIPEPLRLATQAYQAEMDPLKPFLEEVCQLDPEAKTPASDLWSAYLSYCKTYRSKPMRQRDWSERLRAHGVEPGKANSGKTRIYKGISLQELE